MAFRICIWTDANTDHLAQHGVTPDEFEYVLANPDDETVSDSSGRPAAIGYAPVEPVTAYEIED